MLRGSIALTGLLSIGLLLPVRSLACESGVRRQCMQQFRQLVEYRAEAIDTAFGPLLGALPPQVQIKFVRTTDPEHAQFGTAGGYDRQQHRLLFPRRALTAKTPNPLRWAAYYWPFYRDEKYRLEYPVIEVIDGVLWNAFLQEAAAAQGERWPHQDCSAVSVLKRLPCEMLLQGVAEHLKTLHGPLFNSNRLDRIWPENFAAFQQRVWRTDTEYQEVQRYGGILLLRPLIDEFGISRALSYVAHTPFRVEDNNLRQSALRYQERARQLLRATGAAQAPGPDSIRPVWNRRSDSDDRAADSRIGGAGALAE